MISDHFYTTEQISAHIDGIRSKTGEIMYLVKGTEQAFLIDTCLGVGNVRKVAESLTDLPISVILTHGHVDHALGAPLFDKVYFNHLDDDLYKAHSPFEERQGYMEANLGAAPGSLKDEEFVPVKDPKSYFSLEDGAAFDLGGIHLEVYALCGHTQGCMTVLIPEERVLITGDGANNATFVFDQYASTIEEYRNHLQALSDRLKGRYDRCFMMHHDMEASGNLLENVMQVCDDIMSGNTDDLPFDFMGGHYFIAKAVGPGFRRLDGGEGNIVYNKEKVR
ncbi:MAG: MBL fold metallo-hydrolase [Eubacteriales bacterium]|nr:MBL fold metallo-hydrolase [Eubacteriales bacterium]